MGRPNVKQTETMAGLGYMLAAEAARASGWALSWVHRQLEAGKLEGEKAGGSWYVVRTSLARRLGLTLTASGGFLTPAEFREVFGRAPAPGEAREGPQEAVAGAPGGEGGHGAAEGPPGPGAAHGGAR